MKKYCLRFVTIFLWVTVGSFVVAQFFLSGCLNTIFAQSASPTSALPATNKSFNVSFTYDIADKDVKDGDIVIFGPKGLVKSDIPYSIRLFGIVQDKPLIAYKNTDNKGKAVARDGIAQVNVSEVNGPIKSGDYLT